MSDYLVVDDNEAFAENLAEILEDAGHTATIARTGSEALEKARARRYDALLTDMRMPVMSGAQLVHEVRQVDPGLPAIVVTAYSGSEDLRLARREGLLAVLTKPLIIPQMMSLLGSARRDGLIALVEDDLAFADNLTEALRQHGFTAVHAGSVLETKELANVRPFAGLVDLCVPGGSEGEAMRRLAERFPELPLIVITGHQAPPPLVPVRTFRKPFDTAALLWELDRLHRDRLKRQ